VTITTTDTVEAPTLVLDKPDLARDLLQIVLDDPAAFVNALLTHSERTSPWHDDGRTQIEQRSPWSTASLPRRFAEAPAATPAILDLVIRTNPDDWSLAYEVIRHPNVSTDTLNSAAANPAFHTNTRKVLMADQRVTHDTIKACLTDPDSEVATAARARLTSDGALPSGIDTILAMKPDQAKEAVLRISNPDVLDVYVDAALNARKIKHLLFVPSSDATGATIAKAILGVAAISKSNVADINCEDRRHHLITDDPLVTAAYIRVRHEAWASRVIRGYANNLDVTTLTATEIADFISWATTLEPHYVREGLISAIASFTMTSEQITTLAQIAADPKHSDDTRDGARYALVAQHRYDLVSPVRIHRLIDEDTLASRANTALVRSGGFPVKNRKGGDYKADLDRNTRIMLALAAKNEALWGKAATDEDVIVRRWAWASAKARHAGRECRLLQKEADLDAVLTRIGNDSGGNSCVWVASEVGPNHPNPDARLAMAKVIAGSPLDNWYKAERLDGFSTDTDERVIAVIAGHITDADALRRYADSGSAKVRAAVARNQNTPADLLAHLADDSSPSVARAASRTVLNAAIGNDR
jgi:hypothetical protein